MAGEGKNVPVQENAMLTDTALKNLKPQEAMYKVADRDGMCVTLITEFKSQVPK